MFEAIGQAGTTDEVPSEASVGASAWMSTPPPGEPLHHWSSAGWSNE